MPCVVVSVPSLPHHPLHTLVLTIAGDTGTNIQIKHIKPPGRVLKLFHDHTVFFAQNFCTEEGHFMDVIKSRGTM